MELSPYKWKNRLLLVFTPSTSDKDYKEQLRLLEGLESDFENRDLLLGKFPKKQPGELGGTSISSEETSQLGERFDVAGFVAILVGKDGGEKFRSEEPVPAEEIFRRIDAMPMRRREMRHRD